MGILSLILVLAADEPAESLSKQMLPIYVKEAQTYSLAVASAPDRPLELKKEPVFEWLNPARNAQQGAVFLWLRDGRPAALACIFSQPADRLPGRQIMHELHALDPEKLVVKREGYNQWQPQAGLARAELPDAGAPAATAGARLLQMRRLAQELTGHSIDRDSKRWELRLLPTPLYRYPTAKTGVVDGALFALMSSAGTDPEVLLLIEAREEDGKMRWEYACGRFSDWELHVSRKGKEVFASVPSESNPFSHDPLHLYRLYPEKVVTPEGKLLARIRQNPRNPNVAEIIPVEDK
jgi:hypothetical protein